MANRLICEKSVLIRYTCQIVLSTLTVSLFAKIRSNTCGYFEHRAEILRNQPFRDLTVGELMAQAGLSRSAFPVFQRFGDMMRVMDGLRDEILTAAGPWFTGEGDPIPLLHESLEGLVKVCYKQGLFKGHRGCVDV